MFLAELTTPSFQFQAVGATEEKAREAMEETWEAHIESGYEATPFEEWADGVRVLDLTEASGWRDGNPLID